ATVLRGDRVEARCKTGRSQNRVASAARTRRRGGTEGGGSVLERHDAGRGRSGHRRIQGDGWSHGCGGRSDGGRWRTWRSVDYLDPHSGGWAAVVGIAFITDRDVAAACVEVADVHDRNTAIQLGVLQLLGAIQQVDPPGRIVACDGSG